MKGKATPLYPLTFEPALKDYLWGGRNLEKLYNRVLPPGIVAESWEISGHANGITVVDAGPLQGQPLPALLDMYQEYLVGTRADWALERGRFPLLVKLLDANERLSVQVHPPDEYALKHEGGELGKTEMWYILGAQPDAELIMGLEPGVTREAFRQAVENNELDRWLYHLPVKPGDAVFVASGTLHAILEGLVVAEIQQTSDVTYRVYDWGRVGEDGKPRSLHVDKALDVIDFDKIRPGPYEPILIAAGGGVARHEISHSKYFVVERVTMEPGAVFQGRTTGETLEIWGNVEGESELTWSGEPVQLPTIRFCLVPAALGEFAVRAKDSATLLRVYLP